MFKFKKPNPSGGAALVLPPSIFIEIDEVREAGRMLILTFGNCHSANDVLTKFLEMDSVMFKALELQLLYVLCLAVTIIIALFRLMPPGGPPSAPAV